MLPSHSLPLLAAATAALGCTPASQDTPPPPNIVIVLADDLGYGDVSCLNAHSKIPTPTMDRLAAEGVRMTDAHAPSSVCSPTRYALLTGRYAWRGALKSGVLKGGSLPVLEEDRLTLPEMMRGAGYHTGAVGKWHLGLEYELTDPDAAQSSATIDYSKPIVSGPLQVGFDYFFGLARPAWTFVENDRILALPTQKFDLSRLGVARMGRSNMVGDRAPGYKHHRMLPEFTRRAVDFIERAAEVEQPFLLYFAPMTPHRPIMPNKRFFGKSQAGLYGDFVVELDWSIGQLLDALERTGCTDDTLVIVTSDNGPEVIAYERIRKYRHASMGRWRGIKRDLWEGGHRVPFLARWPGRIPAGTEGKQTICLTDLMATCAALAGVRLPDDCAEDSYDIIAALTGEATAPIREATVHHSSSGNLAIRQGDWVYIRAPTGSENAEPGWFRTRRKIATHQQPRELFHLGEDEGETGNRFTDEPEVAARLDALLRRYEEDGRSIPAR